MTQKNLHKDDLHPVEEDPTSSQLSRLMQAIDLLLAQVQIYERVLPRDHYPTQAALDTLGRLAELVQNEVNELLDLIQSRQSSSPLTLSQREFEVLDLTAKGLTNKEIAYRLNLSERTVQFHLNSIFNKTGTNSRTEAVVFSMREGWLK